MKATCSGLPASSPPWLVSLPANREYLGIRIRRLDQSLNDPVKAVFGLFQREFLKVLAIHALAPPVRTRGKRIGADGPDDLDPERARVA